MACGMLAMKRGGYQVDSYDAYEIDKYAIQSATHNFPEIVEHGDIFNADFTEYKDIDFLMGGSPCVPAGSKIKTDNGYKAIEDIEIGDMVLTHKNRYRPVSRLYERQSSHIYHIKFNGGDTLDITGNHPVYTYRDNEFMFVRADELTINDYVCININQQQKQLEYSDDILWLLGRTLADGYYCKAKHCIIVTVGKKKVEDFESHLNNIHYYTAHNDRPAVEYVIKNADLTELYSYFCNKKALDKFIPNAILDLPISQLKVVYNGYISGDGFIRKDKPNTVMWNSSSHDLTLSLGLVTAKLFGKYPTISVRKGEFKKLPNGYCQTNVNYSSQISVTTKYNPDVKIVEDKLLIRIKSLSKETIDIKVYNIETAQDHSYTVNNVIVHNCTYWSIAQTKHRETEASGLGWELFSQYVRALNEIKPRFFIYENNKSMSKAIRESITEAFGFDAICINSALVSAQNRQRLYWVGKRNNDGTYSKVDVQQPEDRGILLRDILDGAMDLTSKDKAWTLTASYDGAVAWKTIERSQRNMAVDPVGMSNQPIGTTKDGKSYCLTAGYSNGSGENIGNYAVHTLEKGCKSMVAEPCCVQEQVHGRKALSNGSYDRRYEARTDNKSGTVTITNRQNAVAEPVNTTNDGKAQCVRASCYKDGIRNMVGNDIDKRTCVAEAVNTTPDEKSQTIKKQYQQTSVANICKYTSTYDATGMAEEVADSPKQVGAMPRPNGELSTSQAFRVYDTNAKSVTLKACGGGAGGKTGLYAIPIEFENGAPTKAISSYDGKTYTVYSVVNGIIVIKGKEYPIKLQDGYYIIRKLTISECKRLQTVPEWYEFPVSNAQAYKMLGNGWTVDVITHLIKSCLNKDIKDGDRNRSRK